MKRKLLAIMVAGISAAPSLAQAATPYVSGSVGLGFASNSSVSVSGVTVNDFISYKSGVPFGFAIGLKEDTIRLEAAASFQTNSMDKITDPTDGVSYTAASGNKIKISSYMANAYYDYAIKGSNIAPYVMGGIGAATIKPEINAWALDSKTVFAWQLGAGVGVRASDNIVVDLGFRYIKPGSYKFIGPDETEATMSTSSSNILAGVRYNF